ncbi:MAG TPA: hypothetical protein VN696_14885 [Pyrinomonadaceae bacterium]|nr:hypothetical protein [Pyrinomonadaceae bacterium]
MKRTFPLIGLSIAFLVTAGLSAVAQPAADSAISATRVFGKVTEINTSAGTLTVKTEAGSVVAVTTNEKTTFQRMPPGETDRSKAEPTSLTEIAAGDGIYALGYVAADRKSVPAQKIYVVSQSEISKRNAAQRMAWARGAKGIVSAINPAAKEITVTSRSLTGASQAVTVAVADNAKLRRYPPDSIPKYENAKTAKFEEIKVGDQLNARGEKNAEGTHLAAEEVLFGTFKVAGGTVTAIDPAANTITINDLQTKKPMTIMLKPETVVRRFQPMMGGMGGGAGAPGGGGAPGAGAPGQGAGNGQGQAAANRPAGAGPGAGGGQGPGAGGPRPGGGMNMADLLERLPTISITELKVGDMIIMSTLPGSDPTKTTAISMVAGVEPLLQMIAARQAAGGQPRPQNVDLNSNFGGMFGGIGP